MAIDWTKDVLGVIVAAGNSRRMGTPKHELVLAGRTFYEHIASALREAGLTRLVVTVSPDAVSSSFDCPVVVNRFMHRQMLGSIQSLILETRSRALLICPIDMPFVTAQLLVQFRDRLLQKTQLIVQVRYQGVMAHPLLITERYYDDILKLSDDNSLRTILDRFASDICFVETNDARLLLNINTPRDYAHAQSLTT